MPVRFHRSILTPICMFDLSNFSTLFDAIDTNKNNLIDFNEFLFLAAIGNRTGSLDERLDIIFDL